MKNDNTDQEVDVMNAYMAEVGDLPLLSIEEEQSLFKQLKASTSSKDSEDIKQKLITSNLRLVVKIANEFRGLGMEFSDLISEGNLGLMNAVDKYDSEKGAKLSYYASFWIKQCIRRAISNKARTIRTPVGMVDTKLKIQKYSELKEKETGDKPTSEQISKDLNIPLKKVNKLIKLNLSCESLNVNSGDSEVEIGDTLVNEKAICPDLLCENADARSMLNKFLSSLDGRQRYIIIRRFGLDGGKPDTLENIGKKFDLTRERIRQLELTGLRALREMYKKINREKYIE